MEVHQQLMAFADTAQNSTVTTLTVRRVVEGTIVARVLGEVMFFLLCHDGGSHQCDG